ncbi:hypothetical protein N7539_004043 [Penicillium diatomitis]|uniref:Uncharacterized protein n=1 Tax=Penicillium diatomitis TaxID=2819901 RepID=A0A9W9XDQ8_9EURO|nr:uncharacterized protein N7539_004043 [Penicillium diatomitis]KAJ5489153.1 hypothetical protein N7539_004043 [Penicillium diatomitis]
MSQSMLSTMLNSRLSAVAARTSRRSIGRALYSSQGYGDGKGDPAAENPAEQGVSRRSRELEHPGPEQHVKKPSSGNGGEQQSGSKDGSAKPSFKKGLENEIARGRGQ